MLTMSKHYEVFDGRTREVLMRVETQDQLLDALYQCYKEGAPLSWYEISYINVHEEREHVMMAADDFLWDWYTEFELLEGLFIYEYAAPLDTLFSYLEQAGYRLDFTEAQFPPTDLDFARYYAQVTSKDGQKAYHSGATRKEAAAAAFLQLEGYTQDGS